MAIATATLKNSLASAYATAATHASLHSAAPGTTGASEISGGSPAYARKASSWSAPSNGVIASTYTFDVASGVTVAGWGVWNAVTAGTYQDGGSVSSSQAFASQGQYTLTITFTQT